MPSNLDERTAVLMVESGAGGIEANDWTDMLLRIYIKWGEKAGHQVDILNYKPGAEAGIQSGAIGISGDGVYGGIKSEAGIHRLVRKSPFDSQNRRHTSFAAVFVYPEPIESTDELRLSVVDLDIDLWRPRSVTDWHNPSARVKHLPTGIIVEAQGKNSQHKNKSAMLRILKARLWAEQLNLPKASDELIRSYVFDPYRRVKDHRTGKETEFVTSVLDGGIELFLGEG